MLWSHIHTVPGSAGAAVPHSLRLGGAQTPGRKPPHASIWGRGGRQMLAAGPPGSRMGGQGSVTMRGTTARDQLPPGQDEAQCKARVTKARGGLRTRSRPAQGPARRGSDLHRAPCSCPWPVVCPCSLSHTAHVPPIRTPVVHTHTHMNPSAQARHTVCAHLEAI